MSEEFSLIILVGILTVLYIAVRRFYMPPAPKGDGPGKKNPDGTPE